MQKKISPLRHSFLVFLVLIISIFNFHCKLNLNNPGDPFSKAFLETFLLRAYLDSLCNPNLRGTVALGSGLYFTVVNDLKKHGNDIYFTASVKEPVVWNNRTDGVNFSFSGSIPTTNVIVGKINGKTFQIDWIDYLGISNGDFSNSEYVSLFTFSNGDIGISTIVRNTQPGSLTSKIADPTPAAYIIRYASDGKRIWSRYLNKPTSEFNAGDGFVAVSDKLDRIHIFYRTLNSVGVPDSTGFSDMPQPLNQTSGLNTKSEIGWATLNGDGTANSQRFLTGNSANVFSISLATAVSNGTNIFLGGKSNDEIAGFTGHPAVGNSGSSVFVATLNLDFSIASIRYYGDSSGIGEANLLKMALNENNIFAYGASNRSFGSPAQPFLSGTNDSLLYMKFDLTSNLLWHSFLGSNTSGLINDPAIVSFENRKNSFTSKAVGSFDGLRFTGYDTVSSGISVNPFPSVTARLNPETGNFQSLFYETNSNSPTTASITRLRAIRHYQDVCSGRMVTAKNEYLNNTGNIGYLEISTRPANEEP